MDATITKVPVIVLTKGSQHYEISPFVQGSTGIASGTLNLQTGIVTEELDFGNLTASELSLEIYNIYFDLQGFNIQLILEDSTTHDRTTLFTGVVDSSKEDTYGISRQVVAYDWAYYHRSDNVASWWNNFWHGVNNRANATLKEIRDSLMQYMGFNASTEVYLNDSIVIPNNFELATTLDFETALKFVCELQATFPHIDANGNMEFISLSSTSTDIQGTYEGSNSSWEDYTTDTITGIGIYSTSDDLAQVVGTDANVYNIAGNLLALTLDASTITTMCNNILQALATVQFVPCEINMIMSDFDLSLGQKIETEKGYSYVMQNVYHGICMVDEMISCKALGKKLSQDVASYNNTMMNGSKISKIEKDIDGIVSTVSAAVVEAHEAAEDAEEALEQVGQYDTRISTVESTIEQHADEIVMKVDSNGRIVQASLTTDPDDGTEFKVSADNISFIANGVMQLSANNLQIDSSNFKVDASGNIIANSGKIGSLEVYPNNDVSVFGWTIVDLPTDADEYNRHYYESHVTIDVQDPSVGYERYLHYQTILRLYYDETKEWFYLKFKWKEHQPEETTWDTTWDNAGTVMSWAYYWGRGGTLPPVPDYWGTYTMYYDPKSESAQSIIEIAKGTEYDGIWYFQSGKPYSSKYGPTSTTAVWNSASDGTGTELQTYSERAEHALGYPSYDVLYSNILTAISDLWEFITDLDAPIVNINKNGLEAINFLLYRNMRLKSDFHSLSGDYTKTWDFIYAYSPDQNPNVSPIIKFDTQYDANNVATFLKYDGTYHNVTLGNSDSNTPMSLRLEGNTSVYGDFKPTAGTYFSDSTALPKQTDATSYNVMCIDAFSAGGKAKYCTGTASATANTVAVRNASGHIFAKYYNTTCSAENIAGYTSPHIPFIDSSGYVRKTSLAQFKAWFGASTYASLNYLGYTSSSTAKNFTIGANTTEIVIVGSFTGDNITKLFSGVIPKNLIGSTAKEVWLSAGSGGTTASQVRCLCNVTLVNSTTIQVKGTAANNGSTNVLSATSYYVYHR